jgi:hypothetical protein
MEACYGGTDVMERSCAVARGIDINIHRHRAWSSIMLHCILCYLYSIILVLLIRTVRAYYALL